VSLGHHLQSLLHRLKFGLAIINLELMISSHTRRSGPGSLQLHVYHGQSRKDIAHLKQYDVVITTFQTLSSIWRKQNLQNIEDPIFSVMWHRVILDEGGELCKFLIASTRADMSQLIPFKILTVSSLKRVVLSRRTGDGLSLALLSKTSSRISLVSSNSCESIHIRIRKFLMMTYPARGIKLIRMDS